ncbi:hypothetical protein AWM75_08170 [Aerococcus urinaehominis]|uniref:Uncharacterized protein n=1 Tax=Aerococcus urinaehominis TaxID=128944 RepID=A0A0X8FMA6_9LACT|nr:hypothetical protein [Aerococcus urinaehominis]AMB99946.1 hypothetical protein AWM75_08170 [Aerococcus urinaehominis]SDM42321.1 PTS system, mannose-specific IIA component [Aerococcus urinaehominis]
MIQLIIATHGPAGQALAQSVEMIMGPQPQLQALAYGVSDGIPELTSKLQAALKDADQGAVIFTDLAEGTPGRVSRDLASQDDKIAVVTGVNIAMLLTACQQASWVRFDDLVANAINQGQAAIGQLVKAEDEAD